MIRLLIFLALGLFAVAAFVLLVRRSGPHVTTIETRRHDDEDRDEP